MWLVSEYQDVFGKSHRDRLDIRWNEQKECLIPS